MKRRPLSYADIGELCRALALLLHAGAGPGDGLFLLAEDAREPMRGLLKEMGQKMDGGAHLSETMEESGLFPAHVTGMVQVGEQSGRTEEALHALADYYEEREQMDYRARAALTYPCILMLVLLAVIGVLLMQVLPVFDEVYASLGSRLTGAAAGLLRLGQILKAALPLWCALLAAGAAGVVLFTAHDGFRRRLTAARRAARGDKGVSKQLNDAHFVRALAMGLSSGLPTEEAVRLAGRLLEETPAAAGRCERCLQALSAGKTLAQAMQAEGFLPASAARLLELGLRGGTGDRVMTEIARRLSEEASRALEERTARVEPALVLTASLLVGAVLLTVMLPLMHIMSAIG